MALTKPFAENGDKKAIPQTTSDGSVSFNNGFGSLYALPPEEGGLFIDRAQFNQLMFDTTSQVLENKQQITAQANRINEVNTTLTQSINTKANQATTYTKTEVNNLVNAKANANAVVNLTDNQTIAGVKTFSAPIVVPNATANTHAVNLSQLNTKANANATVNLTGNQTIAGIKTFRSPVVVPNATANTHAVNLAQLNTKANSNAVVALSGNQSIAGVKTFSALPVCNILPTADTQLANRNYVKKRGGLVSVTGGAINLNNGINFSLNLTAATNIIVTNAAANVGQTGEIYVANGRNIRAFNAPFNFRVAQSGFGANEVFSYLVVSANLVRITRS